MSSAVSNLVLPLMRYKSWADAELTTAMLELPAFGDTPEGFYATAVVRHFHTVDCIFRAHLLGVPHGYTSANPSEPATLPELGQRVREVDEWYVEYASNLEERALQESLHVKFTDGDRSVMTRADILLHVSLHGTYHRGNIGILLRRMGAEPPRDGFTTYLGDRCGAREQLVSGEGTGEMNS